MPDSNIISGERPLFGSRGIHLSDVTFGAGESALKCSESIAVERCRIEGRYVFWECRGLTCQDSIFAESARASSWYGRDHSYLRCRIAAPKMFRELDGLTVRECRLDAASESFWRCSHGKLSDVQMAGAEYCFLSASDFEIERLCERGKYSFQYARNIVIRDSVLDTKDAFWESEGCTVFDSEIRGEYLGWYSRGLRLVRCRISGTQPLCYCKGLVLEDCVFDSSCDRCFEKSEIRGTVIGTVTSIQEPVYGQLSFRTDASHSRLYEEPLS